MEDRDPEDFDPRVINTGLDKRLPIYNVTNLLKEDHRHIPKGSFARVITYKEDMVLKAEGNLESEREISANEALERALLAQKSPMFQESQVGMSGKPNMQARKRSTQRRLRRETRLTKVTESQVQEVLRKQSIQMKQRNLEQSNLSDSNIK